MRRFSDCLEWKVHKHTEWMFQGKVWHDISFLLSMTSTITAPWQPFAKKHANELDRIHPNILFIVSIFSLDNVRLVWERLFLTLQQSDESLGFLLGFFSTVNDELVSTDICVSFKEGPCSRPLFYQKYIFFSLCEVVCRRGSLYRIHIWGRMSGGLCMQGQPDGYSVINIFEGLFTE